jgi:hypothetical protein
MEGVRDRNEFSRKNQAMLSSAGIRPIRPRFDPNPTMEKEKGRDSPPWIVAHSTHDSYPAHQLICT